MACTVLSCDNEKPELVIPDVPEIGPTPTPIEESLSIVASNPVSAFESGGEATVILRTTPWDILQEYKLTEQRALARQHLGHQG